ncbi:MAG: tetratricopeptide repeat protein, partial [Cyanobacteria bacterium J06621_15]
VVNFNSSEDYQIATLANYNPNNEDFIFTAGYPKLANDSPWRFTIGRIFDIERGLLQTKQLDFQTSDSPKLQRASSLTGGYELVYTSITYGGMSGGPVLDSQGRVIGIHGRAEGEKAGNSEIQIGYSLGIPVSTFLGLVPRLGVKPQQLKNNRLPQLNAEKKDLIEKAILSANVSGGNASASQWLERGNQLWRLGRYEEAVKAFDEAINQKPAFIYLAFYGKGLALAQQNKRKEAIAALNQAVKFKPNFVAALQTLSSLNTDSGKLDEALIAINKAIQLQPQNPNLYHEKFMVCLYLGQHTKAEIAIGKAIKLSPRAIFYSDRGFLYDNQTKWDLAVADYKEAIQINPEYTTAYFLRINLYESRKGRDFGLVDYSKLTEVQPLSIIYYLSRAALYEKQEKWDLALADYNKAVQINPNKNTYAYYKRAKLYEKQEKWDLALADYNKAIQSNPEDTNAYYNRAEFYENQKKWDLALSDYNKAIQINPKDTNAYYKRAEFYKRRNNLDLALADYNKIIQINPEDADAYNGRSIIYAMRGNERRAIQDLQKAFQLYETQKNTVYY